MFIAFSIICIFLQSELGHDDYRVQRKTTTSRNCVKIAHITLEFGHVFPLIMTSFVIPHVLLFMLCLCFGYRSHSTVTLQTYDDLIEYDTLLLIELTNSM